jgi:hypothetical protein
LTTPVTLTVGRTYIASVNANSLFADTYQGLASAVGNSSIQTNGPGLFGDIGTRPTSSYLASNYFRDVVFQPV